MSAAKKYPTRAPRDDVDEAVGDDGSVAIEGDALGVGVVLPSFGSCEGEGGSAVLLAVAAASEFVFILVTTPLIRSVSKLKNPPMSA